ncbi:hypothetical protein H5410_041763 [Solanum commersonii]|uniref:Uncharacterized protein n=1 Tax=Solanum commersonii TaxID=4109 RepID=A0A9J5XST5_SOLCO|nr:hypothetical protein H5410_041763 [Solanum commersonii]
MPGQMLPHKMRRREYLSIMPFKITSKYNGLTDAPSEVFVSSDWEFSLSRKLPLRTLSFKDKGAKIVRKSKT